MPLRSWASGCGAGRSCPETAPGCGHAASVGELSGLHGGHDDVGTTAGQCESPLPELIGDLRRAYGKVTVRIREYRSEPDVARAVRDGTVELGFGFLETTDSREPTNRDLDTHNLGTDELCIAPGDRRRSPRPPALRADPPIYR
ncbi:LysR substrate-binding domain-containing protein [Rhodococcus sp. ACS1]|uniref:LysR substrate-binding domain-containing protein n=1 Tax=Rhodococcus sp. ACS1 TaxID=2028570 RepID=UPI00359C9989